MWHFEIDGEFIYADNNLPSGWNRREIWGRYVSGWCLDYTWKLVFGISNEDWDNLNIKSTKEFYEFCDKLGVRYKYNGKIYHNSKVVDE